MSWWAYLIPIAVFGAVFIIIYRATSGHPFDDENVS